MLHYSDASLEKAESWKISLVPLNGLFCIFYMNHDCLEKEVEYRPRALYTCYVTYNILPQQKNPMKSIIDYQLG